MSKWKIMKDENAQIDPTHNHEESEDSKCGKPYTKEWDVGKYRFKLSGD